jgi:hypothetical protein
VGGDKEARRWATAGQLENLFTGDQNDTLSGGWDLIEYLLITYGAGARGPARAGVCVPDWE